MTLFQSVFSEVAELVGLRVNFSSSDDYISICYDGEWLGYYSDTELYRYVPDSGGWQWVAFNPSDPMFIRELRKALFDMKHHHRESSALLFPHHLVVQS